MTERPHPFVPDWPAPAPHLLGEARTPAPALPLVETVGPIWAAWIEAAAKARSAPTDYLLAALLAGAGALVGNTRWVSPWMGWAEPPILWCMAVGLPSSGKSPGLDAVLSPLKGVERDLRKEGDADLAAWTEKADLARLAESAWKDAARAAFKAGEDPPVRPEAADPGPKPFPLRLLLNDATVERLAVILASQPRGTLMARDELAGWLYGMTRYTNGGSDRPFWLEAYGGRAYTVERMGRNPVHIDRLSVGVLGGIQPDKLTRLLLKTDDDGLLARFLPFWPEPAPLSRPSTPVDGDLIETALLRIARLQPIPEESGEARPWIVPFSDDAQDALDHFRAQARAWERDCDGLLLSFIGKLPGLAVRLSLVIAFLDWSASGGEDPWRIDAPTFTRAARFLEHYALPMARRAYLTGAQSPTERAARTLIALLKKKALSHFTTRDILRLGRTGLTTAKDLDPALRLLEDNDIIRPCQTTQDPKGGRPTRAYFVSPAILKPHPTN